MLTLDLVTPEKVFSSQEVSQVVVTGSEGEFGVLEKHSPLISSIKAGVINGYNGDVIVTKVFVTGGFAEVTESRCTILATEAFDLETCTKADAEQILFDLKEKLAVSINDEDKNLLNEEISVIEQLVGICS